MAIYAEMPDGVRLEFPDGTKQEVMDAAAQDYLKSSGISGAPVAPGRTNQPSGELGWDDVLINGLKNIPKSAARAAGDVASIVAHPIDTAKALGDLAVGTGQKAWRKMTGGQEVGDKEYAADAVADYFAERYGSLEGFKRALSDDPVGVAADMSTVFTGGAGLMKGGASMMRGMGRIGTMPNARALGAASIMDKGAEKLTKAAEWTDPLTVAGKGAGLAIRKGFGEEMSPARKMYQAALGLNTGFSNNSKARFKPEEVLRMTEEGLQTRTPVTTSGWKATGKRISGINDSIDEAIDAVDATGLQVNPRAIAGGAYGSDARKMIADSNAPGHDLKAFDDALLDYLAHHGGDTTFRQAQESKKATYKKHESSYRNNARPVEAGHTEAEKALAAAQRQAIADGVDFAISRGLIDDSIGMPLHQLNAKEGTNIALRDAIERATLKAGNKGAVDWLLTGLGAMNGDLGTGILLGAGKQILTSPGMRSRIAFGLDNLDRYGTLFRGQRQALAAANAAGSQRGMQEWEKNNRAGLLAKYGK